METQAQVSPNVAFTGSDKTSGAATSPWLNTAKMPSFPPLDQDVSCSVCIVGGGIAGLTVAYTLAKNGRSVVLLEDGELCSGETGRTTAHLMNYYDDRYFEMERSFGVHGTQIIADSHSRAVEYIQQIIGDEGIDCEFNRLNGYLVCADTDDPSTLDKELAATKRAGLSDVRIVNSLPAEAVNFKSSTAMLCPGQGSFHPIKYLSGLARAITKYGGKIFTHTHAVEMNGKMKRVTASNGRVVSCDFIVVCTNSPVNDLVTMHTKQVAFRTYALGLRHPMPATPFLLWDTQDPYHYVRFMPYQGAALIIVGGEDHPTGRAHDGLERFRKLHEWTLQHFPQAGEVVFSWSGQVMEPSDGPAYIGRNPGDTPNVFICTGDSGMGMTHCTIAGLLIPDLIEGVNNPWAMLYDPSRKPHNIKEFLKDAISMQAQFAAFLTPAEVSSMDEVPPGEGRLIRSGLSKHAVYRHENGDITRMSALCSHLKCIVTWNNVEKSWDCPCHGSRYDPLGHVINGPANSDLSVVEECYDTVAQSNM